MDFFKQMNLNARLFWRGVGLVVVVVVVIAFLTRMFFGNAPSPFAKMSAQMSGGAPAIMPSYAGDMAMEESAFGMGGEGVALSARNIAPQPPMPGSPVGDDSEEYEVKRYNAYIETRNAQETCGKVAELKSRADVIFENADEYERGCSYTFKVKKDVSDEILARINDLHVRDLSESTYTIKGLLEDFTSQQEILERKQETIESTLEQAITAYEDITEVAHASRNADALASIIDSKVKTIERLTQERIVVSAQLDQLLRAKAEQLDRLEYTYFFVNVVENKYVDTQDLKDSWKFAVQDFVRNINQVGQDLTIGLVTILLLIIQYALYLLILLLVAKYGWKAGKRIWRG
ncbi:hypothetical protein H6758_00510 [Candidatus Nomurabacteria bacterium]|nr:hypothetical protein [Candidatus Nomurabacteria bacterium]